MFVLETVKGKSDNKLKLFWKNKIKNTLTDKVKTSLSFNRIGNENSKLNLI